MTETLSFNTDKGLPYPLGVSIQGDSTNFALVSSLAQTVTLCLFDRKTKKTIAELPLSPQSNKTGDVWHIGIKHILCDTVYAYRVFPPHQSNQDLLLDPYAKCTSTPNVWGDHQSTYQPLGEIILESNFNWENDTPPAIPLNKLIIYEMHVRGFTADPSSESNNPGTFLGLIEKIPHLVELGINAVELLPIHEFNELEYQQTHPLAEKKLHNYWGYSTANFFSPMNRYSSSTFYGGSIDEFKMMVKELHKHHIEVILDVVYNHTGEGGKDGPSFSFKGLDNSAYYLLDKDGSYKNYSGCGNTVNGNTPIVLEMIINSLRYWVAEMHVDGFRFDLISALTRGPNGEPLSDAPLIEAITKDPILANVKLIAEPWDAAGLYQVGSFAASASRPGTSRWCEWNGKYRDVVRRFIKKTSWSSGEFAMRLCGSDDLYRNLSPCASLNFVTCHDGFTLADLVSYNTKHNLDNGENNRDGTNDNESWNCGVEGVTTNTKILNLRERQMRNFHLALMLSQGVPMVLMGDEYGHTKNGNNNTWCQDNALNWFQWNKLKENEAFYRFYRLMIRFRKEHSILQRTSFLTNSDVDWHGTMPFKPEWNNNIQFVALTLKDLKNYQNLYIAFNAQDHAQSVHVPPPPHMKNWQWAINTANPSPTDIYEKNNGPLLTENPYRMSAFSAIVLIS
jgi:isoamylase